MGKGKTEKQGRETGKQGKGKKEKKAKTQRERGESREIQVIKGETVRWSENKKETALKSGL